MLMNRKKSTSIKIDEESIHKFFSVEETLCLPFVEYEMKLAFEMKSSFEKNKETTELR